MNALEMFTLTEGVSGYNPRQYLTGKISLKSSITIDSSEDNKVVFWAELLQAMGFILFSPFHPFFSFPEFFMRAGSGFSQA